MSIGLIGRKAGMTRVFTEEGSSIPVTVVEVKPNRISQIKSVEVDGYVALQLTAGTKRTNQISRGRSFCEV
jgi:large subunit ribosomal protein L3